ncbi:MAG: 16S rRNA (cytosine(1402)-N(4))-methyltransferase RsmH [Mycoplasmataceae bacterium]|jgi:16S rRNA (cytosine1402-N4)-methyltransferase|nr:16S rRNA (cytosine(1402)-N(4))-methyltransferase RsmH [Mycoplasmataceae bacterium]
MVNFSHKPVMLNEAINLLNIKPNGVYVDCTAGRGGHSRVILEKLNNIGKLICIDNDLEACNYLKTMFTNDKRVTIFHTNFSCIEELLESLQIKKIDGALLDLGVSSPMLDDMQRGFSYHQEAILDMRMNLEQDLDAKYVLNNYSIDKLRKVFKEYGEINDCEKTIQLIIKSRPIETTKQLVDLIKKSIPKYQLNSQKHPAKKFFQAIRIEVNDEINSLKKVLEVLPKLLNNDGRIVVISFHSLEDRIVKTSFASLIMSKVPKEIPIANEYIPYELLNKKPITPNEEELLANQRSHSAKMRGVKKK